MSGMLPQFEPSIIEQMLAFGLGIVQAHSTLLIWLASILLFMFVFKYLVDQVNQP
jgi:hypothetical protein